MHELALMEELMNLVAETARERRARSVTTIRLEVGDMSGVDPDALRFAFDAVVHDTLAEHATLEIERVPVIAVCPACAAEFAPEDVVYACPICGDVSAEIRRGTELTLVSVEITADE